MADQIVVSDQALGYLNETRPWVKFLAIVGFVFIALMVVLSFVMVFAMSSLPAAPGQQPLPRAFGAVFGFFYLLLSALYVMPCLFLYRYAKGIAAIPGTGQSALEDALKNQKSFWKFMGILMAIVLCIYGFFLLIGLLIVLVAHH
jgi:hypothetical protein